MNSNQLPTPLPSKEPTPKKEKPNLGRVGWIVLGSGTLVTVLLAIGIVPRMHRQQELNAAVKVASTEVPIVNIVTPHQAKADTELLLPGTVKGIQETTIYAQSTGYLRRRLVNIGDRVQSGQLLAEIEAPERDQQLEQARADLAKSQATLGQARADLAKSKANVVQNQANVSKGRADLAKAKADLNVATKTWKRWQELVRQGVVTQQAADEKFGTYQANLATVKAAEDSVSSALANVDAARAAVNSSQANVDATVAGIGSSQANVQRYAALQSFKKITAPFAGTVTDSRLDEGALISTGGNSNTILFKLAQTASVYVNVDVPQRLAPSVKVGQTAQIQVKELPKRVFTGKVVQATNAVDPTNRTMLAQIEIENQDGALRPGMSPQVKFTITNANPPLLVPSNTLVTNAGGTQVAIALPDQTVHYQKVEIGRDFGTEVEIASGLKGDERLITNPTDEVVEGKRVEAKEVKKEVKGEK